MLEEQINIKDMAALFEKVHEYLSPSLLVLEFSSNEVMLKQEMSNYLKSL